MSNIRSVADFVQVNITNSGNESIVFEKKISKCDSVAELKVKVH